MIRERETLMKTKSASFHDWAESLRSHQSKKTKELPVSLIYLSFRTQVSDEGEKKPLGYLMLCIVEGY